MSEHKIGDLVYHERFGLGAIYRMIRNNREYGYMIEWMGDTRPLQYYYGDGDILGMKLNLKARLVMTSGA